MDTHPASTHSPGSTTHRASRLRKLTFPTLALALAVALVSLPAFGQSQRSRETFNADWRFDRFGPMPDGSQRPEPVVAGMRMEFPSFDDSSWRKLNLPHDWGIEGPFRGDLPGNTGKLPWAGIGWYRKAFFVPQTDSGKRVFLDFDGAMSRPRVYVNGRFAGEWMYGYSSFRIDLTPHLEFGTTNTVAVRLDNPPDSSRWYPGGGIYRNVWLAKTEPIHVAHWGVFVSTPRVSESEATVRIEAEVENHSGTPATVSVEQSLFAPGARRPAAAVRTDSIEIAPGRTELVRSAVTLPRPQLWDIDSPRMHTLRTTVSVNGREVDRVETPFGIRSIEWNARRGFLLNGRVVKLNGVCNHHDLGALGAAVNTRAMERQLELLREMGCNAIRTAHNPPAPELLDLCDRMGFLVIDEAFDCWRRGKRPNDYGLHFDAWHERDIANLVRRDRNHPSVILWSSGNEVHEQGSPEGHQLSRQLTAIFHRHDPTRLVTAGCNNGRAGENGYSETFDVMGYNYKPQLYGGFHERYPDQPVFGSETASTVSSRGEYFFPVDWNKSRGFFNFQVSSYDLYAPGWATRPDIEFAAQDKHSFVAGEFVWTGFDYLGEPTPYNRDDSNALNFTDPEERRRAMELFERLGNRSPSRSSYFGILDLCGFKKDRFFLYQSKWRPEVRMVHVLPHWNWPERVGEITPVHAYTSGDEAELFLNGKSLGRKKRGPEEYRFHWDDVKYEPGEIRVVAYKDGRRWATGAQRTTGPAAAVTLEADRARIAGDGQDLSFITVKIVDVKGDVVPRSHNLVRFEVSGPVEIAAVDNGDAISHEPFQASERKAYNGLCLVILRAKPGGTGPAVLKASSDGLRPASTTIRIQSPR